MHHGLEDPARGTRAHLVAKACRVQRGGEGRRLTGSLDEAVEDALRVVRGVRDDLAAEEAVLGGDVALDVDEPGAS
jgi:hypothetical protein